MNDTKLLRQIANEQLLKTSRTFYIPISQLPQGLWEAVASAYLCMRAIDEIEDHHHLEMEHKIVLLRSLAKMLLEFNIEKAENEITNLFLPYQSVLKEVTLELIHWIKLAPDTIRDDICQSTAEMANGMASWVEKKWIISTVEDLDDYTYYVAGLVGVLLSKIWMWHSQQQSDLELAVSFGRGLQAVNIIRNREEDLQRGVDYYPTGWSSDDMFSYARNNLKYATQYTEQLSPGAIYNFCQIPLTLAIATLDTIALGEDKLTRSSVMELVKPFMQSH